MAACNLSIMERFDCEALREKRARAISIIADDQRLRDSLAAQIRNIEIQIAHKRADMEQLRSRPSEPTLPGFVSLDRTGRPRRPRFSDLAADIAQATAQQVQDRQDINRLTDDIARLEARLPPLRQALWDRIERLNEAISARACVTTAMRD